MGNKKRVAIAEDDPEAALFLSEVAHGLGFHTQIFSRGDILVKQLTRETFDLLVLDWNMPGKNGIEVLNWARTNLRPSPPVIMITSRSEKADVAAGLDAGADDYITKPEAANVIAAR
ncbi:MAG: response regulator, partial [Alphaproteobacteria bacterium]|nr:response regulator [Alphaproteobacteria bacterium]